MGGGGREKGKPPTAKREKGKPPTTFFCPELTRHTHRAHARTTRNDFPVELSPPTSDHSATVYVTERVLARQLFPGRVARRVRFCAWKVRSAVLVFPYCVGQRLQPVQYYNFVRGRVDDRSRFHIPKGFQPGIYMPGPHISSVRPRSIGPCASRDSHCVALLLCKNKEERPPVHLMCHCMSLPDPAL